MTAQTYVMAILPHRLHWPLFDFESHDRDHLEFALWWLTIPQDIIARDGQFRSFLENVSAVLTDNVDEECFVESIDNLINEAKGEIQTTVTELAGLLGMDTIMQRQLKPGVTDNPAKAVLKALAIKHIDERIQVASGTGFIYKKALFEPAYNKLIERITTCPIDPKIPNKKADQFFLPFPHVSGQDAPKEAEKIDLDISDELLEKMSIDRCLSLDLAEMKAVKEYFEKAETKALRDKMGLTAPNDIELEIIAQTWSEHCKHKIFNAKIEYELDGQKAVIDGLYKTHIKGLTRQLAADRPDLLSVFEDNAGVVDFSRDHAVCIKVETHNSPSALEPYGGALTGILGVNRDILGTGLGAKPIFNTDALCFVHPESEGVLQAQSSNLLPPETIINGVRKGIEDGGNKSGIPNINGAVFFHDSYRAKPLVFCGTGGIMPKEIVVSGNRLDAIKKHTKVGDTIVMAGGRVGRDGVHGATFSSLALDENATSDVVQIGDPFTQKRLLDFVLAARDAGLITGITDNGAGGLSSSVGEMAQITNGATIDLDRVPLKYPGLADWQIVVSESQERMTISTDRWAELEILAREFDVEVSAIGEFHDRGYFEIKRTTPLAVLDLEFLHSGNPRLELQATWQNPDVASISMTQAKDVPESLQVDLQPTISDTLRLLAHPNIVSRESVVRRFDHEVQGNSVIKAYMGAKGTAACDAAVIAPLVNVDTHPEDRQLGLVVSTGLQPQLAELAPYLMAQMSVDEACRNIVSVGGAFDTITLLDNFCWPDPIESPHNYEGKRKLGQLVEACKGLFDIGLAYKTPLISGKDSMKNNFKDKTLNLAVIPTLLVTAMARMNDFEQAVSSDFKEDQDLIYIVSAGLPSFAASTYANIKGWPIEVGPLPTIDPVLAARLYRRINQAMQMQLIESCHDLSEGGLFVALTECAVGGDKGATIQLPGQKLYQTIRASDTLPPSGALYDMSGLIRRDLRLYGECASTLLITIRSEAKHSFEDLLSMASVPFQHLGKVTLDKTIKVKEGSETLLEAQLNVLAQAQATPLPFN